MARANHTSGTNTNAPITSTQTATGLNPPASTIGTTAATASSAVTDVTSQGANRLSSQLLRWLLHQTRSLLLRVKALYRLSSQLPRLHKHRAQHLSIRVRSFMAVPPHLIIKALYRLILQRFLSHRRRRTIRIRPHMAVRLPLINKALYRLMLLFPYKDSRIQRQVRSILVILGIGLKSKKHRVTTQQLRLALWHFPPMAFLSNMVRFILCLVKAPCRTTDICPFISHPVLSGL